MKKLKYFVLTLALSTFIGCATVHEFWEAHRDEIVQKAKEEVLKEVKKQLEQDLKADTAPVDSTQ